MSVALAAEPRVLSSTPGRVRVHAPNWSGDGPRGLEAALRAIPGVRRAEATPATGNVLVHYDPGATDVSRVLQTLRDLDQSSSRPQESEEPERDHPRQTPLHTAPRSVT
ncbi:MAG TPA: hypothetical protein VGR88_08420, partial [Ktedonobacterales bacterium]|nr:hypothetical protein [Ktedonobacterales bacterium]